MLFKSKIGKIIELTQERKNHVFEFHPDVKAHFPKISKVLEDPDQIRKSKYDPGVLLFYRYFANLNKGKYLAVVVKINKKKFYFNFLFDR
jgi:hypothetical protein